MGNPWISMEIHRETYGFARLIQLFWFGFISFRLLEGGTSLEWYMGLTVLSPGNLPIQWKIWNALKAKVIKKLVLSLIPMLIRIRTCFERLKVWSRLKAIAPLTLIETGGLPWSPKRLHPLFIWLPDMKRTLIFNTLQLMSSRLQELQITQ